MSQMLLQYIATGCLWAVYALRMQHKLYGDDTHAFHYLLMAVVNVALWPLAMLICIVICPVQAPHRRRDAYVNTRSCRHL